MTAAPRSATCKMMAGQRRRFPRSPDGRVICVDYLKGLACSDSCKLAHLDKPERPLCPTFAETGRCLFSDSCFFPHIYSKARCYGDDAQLILQCQASHVDRITEAIEALRLPQRDAGRPKIVAAEKISNQKDSLCLLFVAANAADAAPSIFAAIANDPELRMVIQRAYRCQRHYSVLPDGDLQPALQSALRDLLPIKPGGQEEEKKEKEADRGVFDEIVLRVQCAPKRLEKRVVSELASAPVRLCPRTFQFVFFAIHHLGTLYVGLGDRSWNSQQIGSHQAGKNATLETGRAADTAAGAGAGAGAGAEGGDAAVSATAACRAFFKLEQALRRCPLPPRTAVDNEKGQGTIAVDLGAAPGGWTQCLIEHTGGAVDKVYAVDPGEVPYAIAMAKMAGSTVIHLALKAEDAIDEIAAALVEQRRRIGCMVCDMNVHPKKAVELVVRYWRRGLCAPGCRVVVCFKRFSSRGSRTDWAADRASQRAILASISEPGSCREYHLMANGQEERTVVAILAAQSAEAQTSAAAAEVAAPAAGVPPAAST